MKASLDGIKEKYRDMLLRIAVQEVLRGPSSMVVIGLRTELRGAREVTGIGEAEDKEIRATITSAEIGAGRHRMSSCTRQNGLAMFRSVELQRQGRTACTS